MSDRTAASTLTAAGLRGLGSRTFYSLGKYPDFRVLWLGNVGTMLGQWVQFTAQGYLVFNITGSPFQVGAVGFVTGLSSIVMSPFAGLITDRFSRRAVLMWVTAMSAGIAVALASLVFTGVIEAWMLYPIAVLEGVTASIGQPARQVMVYDVVENEDLANAVAINSLGGNTMRIVGPSLAGAMIGVAGVESAFALQAAAYAISVWFTARLRTAGEPTGAVTTSVLKSVGEGIAYARSHPEIRLLVIMAAIPSVFVYPYVQYIPVFAKDVLGVSSLGFGLLASAVGYGSIVGAILAANLSGIRRRGLVLIWTTLIYQALIVVFALSESYALSFSVLVVAGIANSTYLMLNQVMLQLAVDDEYRGRVLSLYVMMNGITPFSALLMGALIDGFGPQTVVACYAGIAVASVVFIALASRRLRTM